MKSWYFYPWLAIPLRLFEFSLTLFISLLSRLLSENRGSHGPGIRTFRGSRRPNNSIEFHLRSVYSFFFN